MTAHEIIHEVLFITARKRSLGQGNIFTGICHSARGACVAHMAPLGTHAPRHILPPRHACPPPIPPV